MSDESSEDEEVEDDKHNIQGVENAKGLSNMLDSDDSSEDEDGEKKDKVRAHHMFFTNPEFYFICLFVWTGTVVVH